MKVELLQVFIYVTNSNIIALSKISLKECRSSLQRTYNCNFSTTTNTDNNNSNYHIERIDLNLKNF